MPLRHIHNNLFQGRKKFHVELAVLLKGMRNIERHLPRHRKKLHLPCMVEKVTPLGTASFTDNFPHNGKRLHSGQRPREPVADLLQQYQSRNTYSKRFSIGRFGIRLSDNFEPSSVPGIRDLQLKLAKLIVCVTDKSAEVWNCEGIGRVENQNIKVLDGWGSQRSNE